MEGLTRLGIDLTSLIFYIINFGVIVLVLAKFVYKPVIKILDERRKTIEDNLNESEILRKRFEQEWKDKEREHKKATDQLREELASTNQAAQERASEIIAAAQAQAEDIKSEASRQAKLAQVRMEQQVEDLLIKKVSNLVREAVHKGMDADEAAGQLKKMWREIQAQDAGGEANK